MSVRRRPLRQGRHQWGTSVEQGVNGPCGLAERNTAEDIGHLHPNRVIWYGVSIRRFYAVATEQTTEPLIVQTRTADDLLDHIRTAELPDSLASRPSIKRHRQSSASNTLHSTHKEPSCL